MKESGRSIHLDGRKCIAKTTTNNNKVSDLLCIGRTFIELQMYKIFSESQNL